MNTPPQQPPGIPHRDYLERALVAAGEWLRFADPKLLGVVVLLGLGLSDLIDNSGRFLRPHEAASDTCGLISTSGHSCAGIGATTCFFGAAVLAVVTVLWITGGLFSQLTMRGLLAGDRESGPINSQFFFGEVARHGSQDAYRAAVKSKSEAQLLDDLAGQVYEVSSIAARKHRAAQNAFLAVLAFLALWAVARVLLSTVA
jgi:hypothetical protein